jgi:hypothetical protein
MWSPESFSAAPDVSRVGEGVTAAEDQPAKVIPTGVDDHLDQSATRPNDVSTHVTTVADPGEYYIDPFTRTQLPTF